MGIFATTAIVAAIIGAFFLLYWQCERDAAKTQKREATERGELRRATINSRHLDAIFISAFEAKSREAHNTAMEKGWHEGSRTMPEILCLCHSELSEALEAIRRGNPADKHIPEFLSLEVELADVIIRIMDTAEHNKLRVAEAVAAKMKYNKTRPFRHGGKTL